MKRAMKILLWIFGTIFGVSLAFIFLSPVLLGFLLAPSHEFGEKPVPEAPDYSLRGNWAAWPDDESPAERTPQGIENTPQQDRLADAFFLHPTTYGGRDHWVQPMDDELTRRDTDLGTISWQASTFSGCCRVYAPRYRQANIIGHKAVWEKLSDLGYSDIRAAFRHFISEIDPDAPIVLASHSQGTFHLVRLVMEEVDGTPLVDRLVAVYAIGHSLTHAILDEAYQDVDLCTLPTQTGCLVSWDAHEGDKSPSPWSYFEEEDFWNGTDYGGFTPSQRICVNPVTWRADAEASNKADHLGALPWLGTVSSDLGSPLPSLVKGSVSVSCELGDRSNWLFVNSDRDAALKSTGVFALFERNLHGYDYNLFWANIRENAEDRARAFIELRDEEEN